VNEGNSNREAALHFRISHRFVNNMMIRRVHLVRLPRQGRAIRLAERSFRPMRTGSASASLSTAK